MNRENESLRTIIITGGNSGLGYACAENLALYNSDTHIVIASANQEKSNAVIVELISKTGNTHIFAMTLDLASLRSVRAFVQNFLKR